MIDPTGRPTDTLVASLAERYEIVRELGRGGMATVYLARDVRHARQVAIKVLQSTAIHCRRISVVQRTRRNCYGGAVRP